MGIDCVRRSTIPENLVTQNVADRMDGLAIIAGSIRRPGRARARDGLYDGGIDVVRERRDG